MSAGEDSVVCVPLCQGFLKKRKDKIRLRWVTYWFKLHNATLFFYNIKHGSTSNLRGQYYLIEVESVREITWTKKKHYIFEIAMKNGKRKVLAAETADLRQQWICQLLQAMNHHVYSTSEPNPNRETEPDRMCGTQSSPCSMISSSNSQSEESDMLVRTHHSAEPDSNLWSPSMHSAAGTLTRTSHIYTDIDMSQVESSQCAEDEVKQKAEVIELESDYDVLPLCKLQNSTGINVERNILGDTNFHYSPATSASELQCKTDDETPDMSWRGGNCGNFRSLHSEEVIYDTPPSNRQASERDHETKESIYDVPKYVFREKSVNEGSCAKELPEITGLLHDMVACLGGNSADWVRATAPEAVCQP